MYNPSPLFFLVGLAGLLVSCSDQTGDVSVPDPGEAVKEVLEPAEFRNQPDPKRIHADAAAGLRKFISKELNIVEFGLVLDELAYQIAEVESQTLGEARNSILLHLMEGESDSTVRFICWAFAYPISNDPRGLPVALGELPAGRLRRYLITTFTGGKSSGELLEIYKALPESMDRNHIARVLVTDSYFKEGIDSALRNVDSLELNAEKDFALDDLAQELVEMESETAALHLTMIREVALKYELKKVIRRLNEQVAELRQ